MGHGALDIDRNSFTTQTYATGALAPPLNMQKKHFIVAIDLSKSPSDGVAAGEVSFTGEHMRTSLATIQQKGCSLPGTDSSERIFMCLRYDAIVEVSAGGCDLLS